SDPISGGQTQAFGELAQRDPGVVLAGGHRIQLYLVLLADPRQRQSQRFNSDSLPPRTFAACSVRTARTVVALALSASGFVHVLDLPTETSRPRFTVAVAVAVTVAVTVARGVVGVRTSARRSKY